MTHRRRPLLTAPALALALIAGCGGGTDTTATDATDTGGGSETTTAAVDCARFTTVAETLAAGRLGASEQIDVAGIPGCKWPDGDGGAFVQISHVPASTWSRGLPAAMDQVEASGIVDDAENRRKFTEARSIIADRGSLDDDRACEFFGVLASLQNRGAASDSVLNVIPSRSDPRAITGQRCSRGTFTSVLVTGTALDVEPLLPRVEGAVRDVHAMPAG